MGKRRSRQAAEDEALLDADDEELEEPDEDLSDLELDYDPDDFAIVESEMEPTRVMPPSMPRPTVVDRVLYDHAVDLAARLDLRPGARTTALVSGNFIFGDLIEALVLERGIDAQEITISTLSLSQENVDSLRNILEERDVERLNLCVSAYFYSHNRGTLVPYIYQELDVGEKFQIAFCNTHCKICIIASRKGTRYVLHGSANLRSSGCLEQIELEESPALYDFYAETIGAIIRKYPTIDHKRPKIARGETTWQAVRQGSAASTSCAGAAAPGAAGRSVSTGRHGTRRTISRSKPREG